MKFDLRLPFDKVAEQMEQQHGLPMSPATAFEITSRVSDDLTDEYQKIVAQIRTASKVNIDESGMRVDGVNHWIWTFVTDNCTLFVIRKSRGKQVLEEVLGEKFGGYIGCDGLGAYRCFSSRLQRCWAHLLREAKALAEKCVEAESLYLALGELFFDVQRCLLGVPVWMRLGIWEEAVKRLGAILLLYDGCGNVDVERFIGKVRNGFDYWFTFVLVEGLEPTNNVAECALREAVVQRKIFGTLRNGKGSKIYESLMTLITTWKQQKLDLHTTMAQKLAEAWTKQRS
jgi:hypothetical protein